MVLIIINWQFLRLKKDTRDVEQQTLETETRDAEQQTRVTFTPSADAPSFLIN